MNRPILFLLLLFIPVLVISQDIDRVKISGKILAPEGEDLEGVTIYNTSSQLGTIANFDGEFQLSVAENDRVQITALQFQQFTVVIDKGIIDSKSMRVSLNPAVNQLGEVIVSPYDLSGNIEADVRRINVTEINSDWDTTYENLEFGYEFSADQWTSIVGNRAEQAFYNGQSQNGGNILGLVGLFLKNKRFNIGRTNEERQVAVTALRQRFSNTYINETFGIPAEKVNDFIYFIEETNFDTNLLKSENEIQLLEVLYRKSEIYKRNFAEN